MLRRIKGIGRPRPVQPSATEQPSVEPPRRVELLKAVPVGRKCHSCVYRTELLPLYHRDTRTNDPPQVKGYTCPIVSRHYPLDDGPRICNRHEPTGI
jgi:hypothetical protein